MSADPSAEEASTKHPTLDSYTHTVDDNEQKPWDRYFATAPPSHVRAPDDGWQLLHDGRTLEASLEAAEAELVGDMLWGNLGLPINKALECLRSVDEIRAKAKAAGAPMSEADKEAEEEARRECRGMLELSTAQLEEMMEKKGEFGREYRVVSAAWYMLMMPDTTLASPLMQPTEASKAAWEWREGEYERRRVAGLAQREAKVAGCVFDEEAARRKPYHLDQGGEGDVMMTLTVPVPARTAVKDVRVRVSRSEIRVLVAGHPLNPVIDGKLYAEVVLDDGNCWHLDGEYEHRKLTIDLEQAVPREWPCLMRADAPPSPPETPRPLISGAKGEVDVYQETATLERPTDPRYFQWGAPPSGGGSGGARSVARAGAAAAAGTGGGDAEAARARANRPSPRAKRAGGARRAEEDAAASAWASRVREVSVEAPGVQAFRVQREK